MTEKLFSKNFTLLILGQVTSLFGNFILKLALSMYVLDVTGSASIFASILSIAIIPTILLSPLGGILADRANRRNIMVTLDALAGVSVLCAALLLAENNALIVICILLIVLSVLGAFETPTVQACIPTMLEGDNIMKGNAIVNQVASLSNLVAPMLGGVLYAMFGLKPVMYVQGVEDIRKLLMGLQEDGVTILLASHYDEDIRTLCEDVYQVQNHQVTKKEKAGKTAGENERADDADEEK